ncbi:hypothetical protein GE061_014579 [Apolygus lucorum]|uniref:Uncharacterized protein n=1 Tax=Apolygus lucorum TaxID=248454 RepID=A0A6A4JNG6_APOLU|nr:hypothetical protein GE061_014579 [Apolygus lucorum]
MDEDDREDTPVNGEGLQMIQNQVDEVVVIMSNNVAMMVDRGGKLEDLDERAKRLDETASQFRDNGVKLKKKMWWQNKKYNMILGVIGGTILLIFVYNVMKNLI